MLHLIPPPLHRAALRLAHRARHRWRLLRRAPIAGISVVVTDLDERVLLLRHSYGPAVWALPGGGLRRGESPEACARRELAEELGLAVGQLVLVGTFAETISGAPHTAHLYACRTDGHPRPDRREVIEARFFPAHSLPEPLGELSRTRIALWRASQQA